MTGSGSLPIPRDPETFFRSYVRQSFSNLPESLANLSSAGAVVFQIGSRPPLALRLLDGAIEVSEGLPGDTLVQIRLSDEDFEPILVQGAELLATHPETLSSERRLAVLKGLTLERERADRIRSVRGSVAFILAGELREHKVILTPGAAAANPEATECSVRCTLADFLAMQRGTQNPFELLMNGRIQITGDAQIPMALSGLLV